MARTALEVLQELEDFIWDQVETTSFATDEADTIVDKIKEIREEEE